MRNEFLCLALLQAALPFGICQDQEVCLFGQAFDRGTDVPPVVSYPHALNFGVTAEQVSSEAHRTYYIELAAGLREIQGELSWNVTMTMGVSLTGEPIGGGFQAIDMTVGRCGRRHVQQDIWLKTDFPFKTTALFHFEVGAQRLSAFAEEAGITLNRHLPPPSSSSSSSLPDPPSSSSPSPSSSSSSSLSRSSVCPRDVTFVTAAVDLSQEWDRPQRHASAYAHGVRILLDTGCPVVAYVSREQLEMHHDALHPLARLEPLDQEQIRLFRHLAAIDALRTDAWKAHKWNWSKLSASLLYFALVLMKPSLLNDVAMENPYNSSLFVWVDSVPTCLKYWSGTPTFDLLRERTAGDKVFASVFAGVALHCKSFEHVTQGLPCPELPDFTVKGNLLAGSAPALRWLALEFDTLLTLMLARGFLLTEEYYLAILAKAWPRFFALQDRSLNPLFLDQHCLPLRLLMGKPPEMDLIWPREGDVLASEEVHVRFHFSDPSIPLDEQTFVIAVRDVLLWEDLRASEGPKSLDRRALTLFHTRDKTMQLRLPAGRYSLQAYAPLSVNALSTLVEFEVKPRGFGEEVDWDLALDSRTHLLQRISAGEFLAAAGACVMLGGMLGAAADVESLCRLQGRRVLRGELERECSWARGCFRRSSLNACVDMLAEEPLALVHVDGVGLSANELLHNLLWWRRRLPTGGMLVGSSFFDGSFYDACSHSLLSSSVQEGVSLFAASLSRRVGITLESTFPSWFYLEQDNPPPRA
mmetsp:Transcript_27439/g.64742  ORF Transcript_27439/g.64742 Transcript_27439/m.64742 type:complete len:754 (+) Transcript_27439:119-2380(+)